MALDAEGCWKPDLFPKQEELLAACYPGNEQNLVLANGPRKSSKTWACAHAVCQHAWNTDRGNICILTKTMSVGLDSGIWKHLTERFIPAWIGGNFGMEWVDKPYTQNVTKKPACSVTNSFGNVTEISLDSLTNERDVEDRFKGKEYSMIWVNELTKFSERKTFDTLKQALRAPHLRDDQLLLLCDTNPCLIYGKQSVWYKIWYDFRTMTDEQVIEYATELCGPESEIEPSDLIPDRDALKLIEFTVDDNLWLTEKQKKRLRGSFASDPDLYAAYYLGQWVTASRDAIFRDVFKHNLHVWGDVGGPNNKEPKLLVPEPSCYELCSGWDPGGRNCAAVIGEKVMWKFKFVREENGKEIEFEKELPIFKFLDELISVDEDFRMEDYVEQFVRKMAYWEDYILEHGSGTGKVQWRHWSDRNVFDTKLPFTERFWAEHIYDCSGGTVHLMAERGNRGSVQARVDLWRKMLFEDRLFFSADKTPHLIQMCKSIKKGTKADGTPTLAAIAKGSHWKHGFDSASYLVCSEAMDELQRSIHVNVKKRNENQLVSVAF